MASCLKDGYVKFSSEKYILESLDNPGLYWTGLSGCIRGWTKNKENAYKFTYCCKPMWFRDSVHKLIMVD